MIPPIRLLVSDVDGTILREDKTLSARAAAACRRLGDAGVTLSLLSARPPSGLAWLQRQLDLRVPIGAFNGGTIVGPDGAVLSAHHLDAATSREACAMVLAAGAGLWVFADGLWFASDLGHRLIDRERASSFIDPLPLVAADLPHGRIDKIVAVCDDLAVAAVLERDGGAALAGRAEVSRSQPFYCDFTHNLAQKGLGLARLAELAGVPLGQVAALGDGTNDIPMLRAAGLSFAMGQGSEPVRAAAGRVTASNQEDGVAAAIDSLLDEGLATPAAG